MPNPDEKNDELETSWPESGGDDGAAGKDVKADDAADDGNGADDAPDEPSETKDEPRAR